MYVIVDILLLTENSFKINIIKTQWGMINDTNKESYLGRTETKGFSSSSDKVRHLLSNIKSTKATNDPISSTWFTSVHGMLVVTGTIGASGLTENPPKPNHSLLK